jgi:SAM-dependent methyltransferase
MKELYTEGKYAEQYPDWHLEDSPHKVEDLLPSILALIDSKNLAEIKIADIGAGVGGVLSHLEKQIREVRPTVTVRTVGYEISPYAVEAAKNLFPQLEMRQRSVNNDDGPYDVALFVDVLEHLENPWEILRVVRKVASHIAVRQPLLESFSTFRGRNYRHQRLHWGHIAYFNYYSFIDLAEATGWTPLHIKLTAPWELAGNKPRSWLHNLLTRMNRPMASHFMSGFYMCGTFQADLTG